MQNNKIPMNKWSLATTDVIAELKMFVDLYGKPTTLAQEAVQISAQPVKKPIKHGPQQKGRGGKIRRW